MAFCSLHLVAGTTEVKTVTFKEEMETYFKPHMKVSDVFNWQILLDFVRIKRGLIFWRNAENAKELLKFLLELLDSFECYNVSLLCRLLNFYKYLKEYISWFERNHRTRDIISIWIEEKNLIGKGDYQDILNHIGDIYYYLNKDYNLCPKVDFTRVLGTIKSGNIILMKTLVKNGLSYLPPEDHFKKILEENCLRTFLDAIALPKETLDFIFMRELENGISSKWDILLIHNIGSWIGGIRRTALIFLAIKALLYRRRNDNLFSRYAECFQLFFRTIPEPFVTLHEMQDFFSVILRGLDPGNLVQGFMKDLGEVYSDFNTCYKPRTLLDLCRVKIRLEAIKSEETLPQAILKMNIPVNFKKILVGSE